MTGKFLKCCTKNRWTAMKLYCTTKFCHTSIIERSPMCKEQQFERVFNVNICKVATYFNTLNLIKIYRKGKTAN